LRVGGGGRDFWSSGAQENEQQAEKVPPLPRDLPKARTAKERLLLCSAANLPLPLILNSSSSQEKGFAGTLLAENFEKNPSKLGGWGGERRRRAAMLKAAFPDWNEIMHASWTFGIHSGQHTAFFFFSSAYATLSSFFFFEQSSLFCLTLSLSIIYW
jgi:hypothetical protein